MEELVELSLIFRKWPNPKSRFDRFREISDIPNRFIYYIYSKASNLYR